MNNLLKVFSPYGLLYVSAFLEYFPFYRSHRPSISLGPVDLYITDIALMLLCMKTFFIFMSGRRLTMHHKNAKAILVIWGMFFLLGWFKWGIQSDHTIASIRMSLVFLSAYLFLLFYPLHMNGKIILQRTVLVHTIFLVYIFIMHIYAFATRGFITHILGGEFITILALLYFLLLWDNNIIKLSKNSKIVLRCLIIATYIMVGHRSAFIGLMLGLAAYSFCNKSRVLKELFMVFVIMVSSGVVVYVIAPHFINKITERAETTFDVEQETYRGRFNNIIPVLQASANNLIFGKQLTLRETVSEVSVKRREGWRDVSEEILVLTPHNFILEWIYYYGLIGLLLGCMLFYFCIKFIRKFMREVKDNELLSGLPVIISCCMIHNTFWAFTNVTIMSVYSLYFLYLPIVLLMVVARDQEYFALQPKHNTAQYENKMKLLKI